MCPCVDVFVDVVSVCALSLYVYVRCLFACLSAVFTPFLSVCLPYCLCADLPGLCVRMCVCLCVLCICVWVCVLQGVRLRVLDWYVCVSACKLYMHLCLCACDGVSSLVAVNLRQLFHPAHLNVSLNSPPPAVRALAPSRGWYRGIIVANVMWPDNVNQFQSFQSKWYMPIRRMATSFPFIHFSRGFAS